MAKGNGVTQAADATDQQETAVQEALASKPISITRDMLISGKNRPMRTKDIVIPGFGLARVRALKSNEREALDDAALVTDMKTGAVKSDFRNYKARAVATLKPTRNSFRILWAKRRCSAS